MDEELQKRNTDCVYFLASPLTCKKGIECEYRHSEIARLNPRDCWYWLAGSCLNPSCAFRHPPLDVHAEVTEALPDSTAQPHPGSVPVTKSNVPCYFFFNGFCNKGDKCSFLHGPTEDGKPGWKSSKTASAVTAPPPIDTKTSTGSDAGSTPIGTNPNPSKAAHGKTAETQNNLKEDAYLDNINKRSASPPIPVSEPEEAAAVTSGTLLPGKDLINQSPQSSTDQSSEEQMNCHTEREEWLESSPGFDVLVDDASENLAYEGDSDYVLPVDRDGRELNGHFYDYEVPAEYDAIYADAVALYEQDRCVSRDERDVEQRVDYIRNGNERSTMGDHTMGPVYPRKRKYLPVDMVIGGRRSEDLRDHLKKRRVIDDCRHPPPFSRRNHFPSVLADRTRERSRPHQRPRGIMTSEMDNNRAGQARPSNLRQRQKERRKPRHQVVSSEVVVSRRHDSSRKRRVTEESSTFSGPKTLAQIKEDKMKSAEKRNCSGRSGSGSGHHHSRSTEEFQGPKPLSEILKEKSQVP